MKFRAKVGEKDKQFADKIYVHSYNAQKIKLPYEDGDVAIYLLVCMVKYNSLTPNNI